MIRNIVFKIRVFFWIIGDEFDAFVFDLAIKVSNKSDVMTLFYKFNHMPINKPFNTAISFDGQNSCMEKNNFHWILLALVANITD